MAERVWVDVLVDDLYDGDTVEGFGIISDMDANEMDWNCGGDCCGQSVLTYSVVFESGTTQVWKFSKPVRAFVDPDWTVIRNEDARKED